MKLSKIEITNFRCFQSLVVDLQPNVNVFVGVNGAGKTSILDAIAISLYDVIAANGKGGKRQRGWQHVTLRPTDIHVSPNSADAVAGRADFVQLRTIATELYAPPGFSPLRNPEEPLTIEWTNYIQYRPPSDFDYDNSQSNRVSDIYRYFEQLWQEVRQTDAQTLIPFPVVAYYRASRRISEMPDLGDIFSLTLDRQGAFQMALDAGSNYRQMCQWWYLRENAELRERLNQPDPATFELSDLKAVRHALRTTLENVGRIFFDDNPPRLKAEFLETQVTPKILEFEQLSDGYRNLLAVVFDFARRLAQAHPNWAEPLKAPGILLIDEIELHLHPTWQQTIVPNLRAAFPNTQLIVATHSPQVVTTVEAREIQLVDQGSLKPCPAPTYGARSSDVVAEVLGVPNQRPPNNEIAQKISALFTALDNGRLEEAKQLRSDLQGWAKGYPEPDLVRADVLLRRLEYRTGHRPEQGS